MARAKSPSGEDSEAPAKEDAAFAAFNAEPAPGMSATAEETAQPSGDAIPPAPPEPPVLPPAPQRRQRAGFLPTLLGGAVAAGLGFGLAQIVPAGWPLGGPSADLAAIQAEIAALKAAASDRPPSPDLSPLADGLDALQTQVSSLETALASLPAAAPAPDLSGLTARIEALEANLSTALPAAAPADLAPLEARIARLEARPAAALAGDPQAAAQLASDLAAIRAELSAQTEAAAAARTEMSAAAEAATAAVAEAKAEAERLKAEGAAAVAAARRDAALGRVAAAVDSGAPFAIALAELAAEGTAIPEVLATQAETGVPTLLSLQSTFPEAARAALEASLKADMGDTTMERIGTFLRTQTGARALEPREGADPDAVLSRAEAALAGGDLPGAVTEIGGLPEAGLAELADWRARAQARLDALAAVNELAAAP